MHKWVCVVPFLSDDSAFAHGVEFGMLYAQMQSGTTVMIKDYFLIDNQEQILLLANRLGWKAELHPGAPEGWFSCCLAKK